MNTQQEHLLDLLKDIHDICSRNAIRYYIWGGTLIGAARNEGFLPWDDDADIMMPYEDWKKFAKACERELPPNRHLGAAELDERYCHIVPRFVSTNTTAIHTCQSLQDDVAGMAIDIFILDPIADGEGVYEAYLQDMHLYSAIVNYANVAGTICELDAKRYSELLEIERREGRSRTVEILEGLVSSHHGNGSRYAWRWQSVSFCMDRAWFAEPRLMRFEDTWLFGPAAVNECLTKYYGQNWAEIPNDITPAKHNAAFSLEFPYSEALEFYHPAIDRKRLYENLCKRKQLLLETAPEKHAISDSILRCRASIVKQSTEATVARNRERFDRALAERDGLALAQILGSYLAEQTHADFIGGYVYPKMRRALHPVFIDVDDDVLEGALIALLSTDRLRPASRLLELRKASCKGFTELMNEIAESLEMLRSGANDFEKGDYRSGTGKGRELSRRWPQCSSFHKLACTCQRQLWLAELDGDAFAELEQLVAEGLARWTEDGFYLKLKADCLGETGQAEEARRLYLVAAESTRNGFALHDIAAKTGYWPTWIRETPWGREAGVPSWDGEAIAAPGKKAKRKPVDGVFDERQWHLLDLLAEAAEALANGGVRCVLAPATARALARENSLPAEIAGYALTISAADLDRACAALNGAGRTHRTAIRSKGAKTGGAPSIRYHSLDTLYCNLPSNYPGELDTLYVDILANGKGADVGNAKPLEFGSHAFPAAADLDSFLSGCPKCKTGSSLVVPKHFSCTSTLSPADLAATGLLDPDAYLRRKEINATLAQAKKTSRQFKKNFAAIKLAVKAKDLSLQLPAKRKAILSAIKAGSIKRVSHAVKEYAKAEVIVKWAKRASKAGKR